MWTLMIVACATDPGPAATGGGPEPQGGGSSGLGSASGPDTQIGGEGTGVDPVCVEGLLALTDLFPSPFDTGLTVGDVLGVVGPDLRLPTWFDGRSVAVTATLTYAGGPVRLAADCTVTAEVEASMVSDDGAVDQHWTADAALTDFPKPWVSVDSGFDPVDWTGGLTGAELPDAPCATEVWRLHLSQSDTPSANARHFCDPGARAIDTGGTDPGSAGGDTGTDGGGGTGTGTGTGTTIDPPDEDAPVVLFAW
ncbi:MAG: hypothetical protein ABMB14_31150 [Myxococcota bacterium]